MFPQRPLLLLPILLLVLSTTPSLAFPSPSSNSPPQQQKITYDGVQVLRIHLGADDAAVDAVSALIQRLGLATWTDVVARNAVVDVEVPREKVEEVRGVVEGRLGLVVGVMHEDLGRSVREESESRVANVLKTNNNKIVAEERVAEDEELEIDVTWFDNYHPYDEHIAFLTTLAARYPTRAEIVVAGKTYEGRNITGIHIHAPRDTSSTSNSTQINPAVIFHGTVHAREWITTLVNEYFIYTLLTDPTASLAYTTTYDFYIFPIVNPDGFVYTQTTARLWRKNRNPITFPNGTVNEGCVGTDINRNWAYKWDGEGSSTDPCSEAFRGNAPGDTYEFQALSRFQDDLARSSPGVKMYIDWHAYSQLFMTPYGYTCDLASPDAAELEVLAKGYVDAVEKAYGTRYTSGPICTTIYQVAGDSVDYSYEVSGVKYSFTTELRDEGVYGFILPREQILETARESWEGVRFLLGAVV